VNSVIQPLNNRYNKQGTLCGEQGRRSKEY